MANDKLKTLIANMRAIYKKYKDCKDFVDKVSEPTKQLVEMEGKITKSLAEKGSGNIGYENCDNDELKQVYVLVVALTENGISPAWEKPRNKGDWLQAMSKKIWGIGSLQGGDEFGPKLIVGEAMSQYHQRRALGARNTIAELDELTDYLSSLQELFASLAEGEAVANAFGIAYATFKESSLGYACGMLLDSIGKRAKGGEQRINKILKSMDWLIPSLQQYDCEFDNGLNSNSPNAGRIQSSSIQGIGSLRHQGPCGRG